jgi:hypothetical protein
MSVVPSIIPLALSDDTESADMTRFIGLVSSVVSFDIARALRPSPSSVVWTDEILNEILDPNKAVAAPNWKIGDCYEVAPQIRHGLQLSHRAIGVVIDPPNGGGWATEVMSTVAEQEHGLRLVGGLAQLVVQHELLQPASSARMPAA